MKEQIFRLREFLQKSLAQEEKVDYRILVIIISVPVLLTILEYWGSASFFREVFFTSFAPKLLNFYSYLYWSFCCFVLLFFVPLIITNFVLKESAGSYGLSWKDIGKHLWLYGALYLLVLPFILLASYRPSFLSTYPFYWPAHNLLFFIIYEIFYLIQFVYVEFFFRGYILFGLERKFSFYAVFLMVIPYCMIHFHKPAPEAFASILAGIVLGIVALKTRSIVLGVLIHMSVALTMDFLAVCRKGLPSW